MSEQKPFLSNRAQMAIVGVIMWLLLALWTISAFWQHIDELGAEYRNAAKAGATAGEFAILAFVLWHCFNKHLGVRRWALIFSFILSGFVLVHAGALRGLNEATTAQINTEQRMTEALTQMSRQQAESITSADSGSQQERLAKNRAALAQKAEVAKNAQKEVAATIATSADKAKESSIFPRWYLDGWMYSILFIASLAMLGVIFLLMMRDDIDADFDGIADKYQKPRQPITMAPTTAPATAQKSNFYDPTSGKS